MNSSAINKYIKAMARSEIGILYDRSEYRVVFSDSVRRLILKCNSLTAYKGMHWAQFASTWELRDGVPDSLEIISHKEFDYLYRVFNKMLKSRIWHKEPDKWNAKGKKRAAKENIGKDNS